MRKWVCLFFKGIKIAIAERMAYRGDFIISFIFAMISQLIFPFITYIIYSSGAMYPGWSIYEVLLLQGIFSIARGVSGTIFHGVLFRVHMGVREGSFDLLLLKPLPAVFSCIITGFNTDESGSIFSGILLFILALLNLPLAGLLRWLLFILLFGLAIMVLFSLTLFISGTLFVWIGNSRLWEILDMVAGYGNYPASIFSDVIRPIIMSVIPVAMIAFFPASALLGKLTSEVILPAVICILFLGMSLFYWHKMLSKYTSAGG